MKPLHPLAILAAACVAAFGAAYADDTTTIGKAQLLNPLENSKVAEIKAFAERPLFSAKRRPQAQVETPVDTEPVNDKPSAAVFTLLGVTSGPEGAMARIAMSGKDSRSVRKGEEIDGWNVRKIDGSSVVLVRGDETTTLTIFNKGASEGTNADEPASSDGGIVFGPADAAETGEQKTPVRVIESK